MRILFLGSLGLRIKDKIVGQIHPSIAEWQVYLINLLNNTTVFSIPIIEKNIKINFYRRQKFKIDGLTVNTIWTTRLPVINHICTAIEILKVIISEKKQAKLSKEPLLIISLNVSNAIALSLLFLKFINIEFKHIIFMTDIPYNSSLKSKVTFGQKVKFKIFNNTRMFIFKKCDGILSSTINAPQHYAPRVPWLHFLYPGKFIDFVDSNKLNSDKLNPKILVYAGFISNLYSIHLFAEILSYLPSDYEIHLYGYGSSDDLIILQKESLIDNRLKLFKAISYKEALNVMFKASMLLLLYNPENKFSEYKYAFPSKVVDCLKVGTPVLSTYIESIPAEINSFLNIVSSLNPEEIAIYIQSLFNDSEQWDNVLKRAEKGKLYITDESMLNKQKENIIKFINKVIYD